MNKTAIKNYAVAARRKLIEAVRQKAFSLYIYENGAEPSDVAAAKLRANSIYLTDKQMEARQKLCAHLAQLSNDMDNKKAYHHVVEEVAYTWFNRLIALRFMETNDFLPSGIRILSSVEAGRAEPDAMREAERLPYVDQDKISEYRSDTKPGAFEKLYKYILISKCNALHDILPGMFQKINDYTELLLPDALYQQGGIVHDLVNAISEADFKDQVQIIGWLYQYYISEKKDEVFADLKKNIKINKETIPAATQLFTPEWIVKYMVENSLGRLWLERDRAESSLSDEYMNATYYGWKYYVEEAEQEPEVAEQLKALVVQNPVKSPEDIKLIDPCMGSGHILVYAFDVLHQIYLSQGYAEREIPNLILQNNIYGLDIDERAAQLAYFALMMKARSYSRRFLRQDNIPQPHVHAVIESDVAQTYHLDSMGDGMSETDQEECKEGLGYLIDLFRDAREYGSILKVEQKLDYDKLRNFVKSMRPGQMDIYDGDIEGVGDTLVEILDIAKSLTQKYDIVVTNPPYMGSSGMGVNLSEYLKKHYPDSKSDLFAVFIEQCGYLLQKHGYQAMITMESWMFLSSFEKLRSKALQNNAIINLVHMPYLGKGGTSLGISFGTAAFVLQKNALTQYVGQYMCIRYYETDNKGVPFEFPVKNERYKQKAIIDLERVPGRPLAYWVSEKILSSFETGEPIQTFAPPKQGLATADNDRFLRLWFEPRITDIGFHMKDSEQAEKSGLKWFPYNKGGPYRRWYGNREYVVNWEQDGYEIKNFKDAYGKVRSRPQNQQFYFKPSITWSDLTSATFSGRYCEAGFLFDIKGSSGFPKPHNHYYALGLLNSVIAQSLINILNPTLTTQVGDMSRIPVVISSKYKNVIESNVMENVQIAQIDWDFFETSWDFQAHPLIKFRMAGDYACDVAKPMGSISSAFEAWEMFADGQFETLKANEKKLNYIFIEIYGLQDESTQEVEDKEVTIRKADLGRDIRSFLSYAVGCMFGRYSLDEPGLVFAGGEFDMSRYKTFLPEEDNILSIGSEDYFDDDIVLRFAEFLRTVYGDATLNENLNFIADALYPNANGSAKDKIRRYFLNDFYKDHLKIYQKRPIYWLMDSGKKDGFKALFYLHRFDKYTVARARTDYLHPLQRKYEAEISRLELLSASTDNAREKETYRKEVEALQARIDECRIYDQVVAHIAHQQIGLDLDNGVKVNYAKFQGVEVPKDNGKVEEMDLLAKI
ncbi:hypothetical protein BBD42_03690 [Paenibacillus sp. BIHB 4019]|uniref:site-specific DNA-methyltransferase (adenine-specific) n=1 Tax=Paenibacillus sp. BIHB 4019 TaxID=1870819 RepID=A0A1B2DD84_9BACL|nr:BREX-1 system adenine-specific DNA-methyltransferase PglX [Paenibacillus sp. BIHB 4019]ANY65662.1 hypothetical protein BBD42_03690 [Paenibacillus sp. BIHB 4019]